MDVYMLQDRLESAAQFLSLYGNRLIDFSYDTMRKNDPDTAYEDLTWADVQVSLTIGITISVFGPNAASLMDKVRRLIGGKWDKQTDSFSYSLTQTVQGCKITIQAERELVCTARIVGTETVEVPDYDNMPKKTVTRDIVEYDCPMFVGTSDASN